MLRISQDKCHSWMATQDLRLQAVSTVLFGANRIVKVRFSELFVENIHFTIF